MWLLNSWEFFVHSTQPHSHKQTSIKFNCIVNWLKFSHSLWLELLINIFFLFFSILSHLPSFYISSPSSSSPKYTTWTYGHKTFLPFIKSKNISPPLITKKTYLDHYRGITDHRIFLTVPRLIFEGVVPHRTNHPTLHQVIWSFYVVFMRLCKWVDHRWVSNFQFTNQLTFRIRLLKQNVPFA